MAKAGRPTDDKKDNRLEIRLSNSDMIALETLAGQFHISQAEVIRSGIRSMYKNYCMEDNQK